MPLPMARPVSRKGSRHYYFRKRIPEDVLGVLRTAPGWSRRGWGLASGEITLSLERERNQGESDKATHARLNVEAERIFQELRRGVRPLNDEEIGALAGEAYALATLPDGAKFAAQGTRRKNFSLSDYAAELVAAKGIRTDAQSIERLSVALSGERGALIKAVALNEARAAGDYSRGSETFPGWSDATPQPREQPSAKLKLSELIVRFYAEHKRLSELTRQRYRPALAAFTVFLKDKPAALVTEEDIRSFKVHRLEGGERTEATYYRADLPAIKSLFKWATDRERHVKPPLSFNPASAVRVLTDAEMGRAVTTREGFYEEEMAAILRGALAVKREGRDPLLADAKRWCPWIAAYTGARIASITGLCREDIRTEGGGWFFTFLPAKGYPRSREVPIHADLIERGFIDFVKSREKGPLFYSEARKVRSGSSATPAQNARIKLRLG